jgi:hypothetical protein
VAQQMPEHAHAEDQRRRDASAIADVEVHSGPDDPDVDALKVVELAVPLAQRDVRDVVAGVAQAQGEVAVPALRSADGVGEQTVVDEADADRVRVPFRYPLGSYGATFVVPSRFLLPGAVCFRLYVS